MFHKCFFIFYFLIFTYKNKKECFFSTNFFFFFFSFSLPRFDTAVFPRDNAMCREVPGTRVHRHETTPEWWGARG